MRILIIDDTQLNIEKAKEVLSKNEIDCIIFESKTGIDALELLKKEQVDIILLDIVMPGISGIEVLKRLRSDSNYDDVPIVMFTSLDDRETLKKCFENGATDFVTKPIEIIEFTSRIKAAERLRNQHLKMQNALHTVSRQNDILKDLNIELKQTKDYLVHKEKLAAIGELAAGVAHEINNPMGYISSNTETLGSYTKKIKMIIGNYRNIINEIKDQELLNKVNALKHIEKEIHFDFIVEDLGDLIEDSTIGINKVTKIVKTLRNFARSGNNDDIGEYNLVDIIDETLLLIKNEYKYDIDIHKSIEVVSNIICDKVQLGQVFINILVNAIQAIKSQIKDERGIIEIIVKKECEFIRCEIIDNGPGMDEETLNKIFLPFYTTKEVGEGTGLGLSISYDIIVNKHKGQLYAKSKLGEGTKFIIKLPI